MSGRTEGGNVGPDHGLPDDYEILRYGSGRSSLEKPNRWLFFRYADRSSPFSSSRRACSTGSV